MTKWEYYEIERPLGFDQAPRMVRYLAEGLREGEASNRPPAQGRVNLDNLFSEMVATLGSLGWELVTILLGDRGNRQSERWVFKRAVPEASERPEEPAWML